MNITLILFTFSTLIAALFNPLVSDRGLSTTSRMSLLEKLEEEQVSCNVLVVKDDRLQKVCKHQGD